MIQENLRDGLVKRTYLLGDLSPEVAGSMTTAALGSASLETGKPVDEINSFQSGDNFVICDFGLARKAPVDEFLP